MSRVITKEEARKMVLEQMYEIKEFWEKESREKTLKGKMEGCIFSILALLDGSSPGLPMMHISLRPHDDDERYHKANDENWFESGQVINDDVELHNEWAKLRAEKDGTI